MTNKQKKEVLRLAADAWLVWGWLYSMAGEDAVKARNHAKNVSSEIIDLLSEDSPTDAKERAVAVRCMTYAKIVNGFLSEYSENGPVLCVDAESAPLGIEPGDYNLADIRGVCERMSDGLTRWASAPIDSLQRNLKRCPFCNGEAKLEDVDDFYGVRCKRTETCGAQVFFEGVRHSREGTYEAWQRRRSLENIRDEKNYRSEFIEKDPAVGSEKLKPLRPCPFCGGLTTAFCEAGNTKGDRFGVIVCMDCGANAMFTSADDQESVKYVADRWNRRDGEAE